MTKKIFRSICLVSFTVMLAVLVLIMGVLYDYFSGIQQRQLKTQTLLAAKGVGDEGLDYFSGLDTQGYRISWINPDGSVIYDSEAQASQMENHMDREEIREALETGYGESSRYSTTLTEKQFYSAALLSDGTVVRLSDTQYSMLTLVLAILQPMLVVIAAAVVLALVLASGLSRKIMDPLNGLDLDKPLSNSAYPELSTLLQKLDSQQCQIRSHLAELERRREELDTITNNMSEGFALFSDKGRVISINRRASALLKISGAGESVYTSGCGREITELVDGARGGLSGEKLLELEGSKYRFSVNPVMRDSAVTGAAMIIFDVTEKERSEELRREFTANVSHELKTPLHSISGCAELLKNGLVKPQDTERFASQIYSEAQRMIHLVDNIIKLSRLDEGAEGMVPETMDLHEAALEVVKNLQPTAGVAGVSLSLEGASATISGIPQLISGIIFNLCDNGIKYNRSGGYVRVETGLENGAAKLTVSDNGVGISPEDQERIFERFYRVDKSHSKQAGGTGLGLSIVKHAARLHNAKIELHSQPGKGTSISLIFPKSE